VVSLPRDSQKLFTALNSGTVDIFIAPRGMRLLQSPEILSLAVFSEKPLPSMDVMTAAQQDFPIFASLQYGIVAPLGIPTAIIKIYESALANLTEDQEFVNRVSKDVSVDAEYKDAAEYGSSTQTAQNDYCSNCDCKTDSTCKKECKKCDK
jgi:tripartite-type tricarboxylate transporter receptor subunit TctC